MFNVPTRTITRQMQLGSVRSWGVGGHKRGSAEDVRQLAVAHDAPPELDAA